MNTTISLEDFIKNKSVEIQNNNFDETVRQRSTRSIKSLMSDVWGEANHSVRLAEKAAGDEMESQLQSFSRICDSVYIHPNVTKGLIYEMMVAEWEIYDFTIGENKFGNNKKSVMLWFNEMLR